MASRARTKVIEQLLVEASDNNPRKVHEGSVRLSGERTLDWSERTPRGLVARTGLVDMERFWDLVDDSLNPYGKTSSANPSPPGQAATHD